MKRMIAYIYHYGEDNGILRKCGTVGFCRVEQNNDIFIVVLSLKDSCGIEGMANISILSKNIGPTGKEAYSKVRLNRCHTVCNGVLNVKLDINRSDGICVECCGRTYIGLWNECVQNIELVENLEKEKSQKGILIKRAAGNNRNKKFEEKVKKEVKVDVGEELEDIVKQKSKADVSKEKMVVKKENTEKTSNTHNVEKKKNVSYIEDYARIYNRLCKVRMILNGAEYPAVKLKPHELIMLPRACWRMANNIFLMEGYYRYGHILFMQYEGEYVLAVPWQNKRGAEEKAKQCGFIRCITGHEYGRESEERLYWIKYL